MKDGFIQNVYLTLYGALVPECGVPGVRNLFEEGSQCDNVYARIYDTQRRLEQRLGKVNQDEDVEALIQDLCEIQEQMCYWMYYYGAQFGMPEEQQNLWENSRDDVR